MKSVLVLLAHPRLEQSRVHKALYKTLKAQENITVQDLYELYPDYNINVQEEQELLLQHDIIVWQHPIYWYSCPPLLKQWIDLVLEHGWAYGKDGIYLKDKIIFQCISFGGPESSYQHGTGNQHTVNEFLSPFRQTAKLCKMKYLPPFVIHGTHRLNEADIAKESSQYLLALRKLQEGWLPEEILQENSYLNHLI
jgi:glutathione-regulated potassium-efflux system ancillary protein KefG